MLFKSTILEAECKEMGAPTATVLTLPELAQIAPEAWSDMHLQAHPTVRRLDLSWNTIKIWQALSQDKQPDEPIQMISQCHGFFGARS